MTATEKVFYWLPRILSIGFAIFLSLFALDVFSGPFEPMMLVGFAVHILPSLVLLGAILLAWKYDLVGVVMFFGFAVFYVWSAGLDRPWSWYASIALPSAVVGILFLVSWLQKRRRKKPTPEHPSSTF
jgi:glucose dehydrogenase